MKTQKDDSIYVDLILDRIQAINEFIESKDQLLNDRKTQKAVLKELQEVFGSTDRFSQNLKDQYPDIDWSGYAGFRNVITHNYFTIDFHKVWDVIQNDLPRLKEICENAE